MDNDETVLTKRTRSDLLRTEDVARYLVDKFRDGSSPAALKKAIFDDVTCDRFTSTPAEHNRSLAVLQDINELKSKLGLGEVRSLYYGQTYFLPQEFMIELVKSLNALFENAPDASANQTFGYSLAFAIGKRGFSFTITSKADFEYAKSLWLLYKHVIQPYYDENKKAFANNVRNFDRFFVLTGSPTDFSWGKTIHDTRRTFDFSIHHARRHIVLDKQTNTVRIENDPMYLERDRAVYGFVPHAYSYESHFRDTIHHEFKQVPIKFVQFDVNYFNCYFRPILQQILAAKNSQSF